MPDRFTIYDFSPISYQIYASKQKSGWYTIEYHDRNDVKCTFDMSERDIRELASAILEEINDATKEDE